MRVRNVQRHGEEKVELQMTPMIDIVFQLLIFFIMTFKIVTPEGDFGVTMPRFAPSVGEVPDDPPLHIPVTLKAHPNGELHKIIMGDTKLFEVPFEETPNPPKDATRKQREKLREKFEEFLAPGYAILHAAIRKEVCGEDGRPQPGALESTEVEIEGDPHLKYYHVMHALTDISGYTADDGETIVKIVEKIKFAPPPGQTGSP